MISIEKTFWFKENFALIILSEDLIRQPLRSYHELSNDEKDLLRQTQVFKDEVIQVLGVHENFSLVKKYDGTLGWIPSNCLKAEPSLGTFLRPSSKRVKASDFISAWKGRPYVFGGISQEGIDCSGFTQLYYRDVLNISLPKNSSDQRKLGSLSTLDAFKDHDLIFCRPLSQLSSHHVAVYYKGLLWHSRRKGGVVSHAIEEFLKEFKIEEVKNLRTLYMEQKKIASSFLQTCALGNPREAYDQYVSADFIHHNQYFKGDRQSLLLAMEEAGRTSPNKSFKIKQIIEENDRVFTYSQVVKENMEIAVVHMFRFENGKIAELWDVGQPISKDSPNENGLF